MIGTADLTTLIADSGLIAIGTIYLVASALLFMFGANMVVLSVIVWREHHFSPKEPASGAKSDPGPDTEPDQTLQPGAIPHLTVQPSVTVQLPIYNELYVAERVINAACNLHYPPDLLQIQVLDDSTDETKDIVANTIAKAQARGIDVVHLHRDSRSGYKAGALAAGLESSSGEFVAIFDADFVPPKDFLTKTLPHFADPEIGFVQARWGHLNRSYSWITRLQALAIDGHFMVEQSARGVRGFWFNFNGTAGIWRTSTIDDAGGWTHETLTEDLDLSYRAHLCGWKGRYLSSLEVPGELPAQMSSFRRQQHRWARGSLECAAKLLKPVWRSNQPWSTKLQATLHLTAYSIHLLLFALALVYPLVVIASTRFAGYSTLFGLSYLFAFSSLAPGIFFATGQHQLGRSWWKELPRILAMTIMGSGLMLNTVRAAVQIFTHPNPEFERTAKFAIEGPQPGSNSWTNKRYQLDFDRIIYAEAILGLYCLFSSWLAWTSGNWGMSFFAAIFGTGLLGVVVTTVGQAISLRRTRRSHQANPTTTKVESSVFQASS